MEDGIKALPDMIQNFRIRSDLRARKVFRTNENGLNSSAVVLKRSRVRLKAAAASSTHGISEPVGVDNRWHAGARRRDCDISPRARRTERLQAKRNCSCHWDCLGYSLSDSRNIHPWSGTPPLVSHPGIRRAPEECGLRTKLTAWVRGLFPMLGRMSDVGLV